MREFAIALPVAFALVAIHVQALSVTAREEMMIAVTHDWSPDRKNDDHAATLNFFA
jgi:hypothetical protein